MEAKTDLTPNGPAGWLPLGMSWSPSAGQTRRAAVPADAPAGSTGNRLLKSDVELNRA